MDRYDYSTWPIYETHPKLAMLLTKTGGTYRGWAGGTIYTYPFTRGAKPKNPKETNRSYDTKIRPGQSEDDIKREFDRIPRVEYD